MADSRVPPLSGPAGSMQSLLRGLPSAKVRSDGGSGEGDGDGGNGRPTAVYLNVYDLTPINNYLYWFGLGIFHSGIEVHGMEYGFGAHEYPTSGVFEVVPKNCPGFAFRRSVWLGTTDMSKQEFRSFIEELAGKYHGDSYHLISKNCNHFTHDVGRYLTGKHIPGWVNRLARIGSFFSCFLPESIQVNAVRRVPIPEFSEDGSESIGSIGTSMVGDSEEEELDHHLLMTPGSDLSHTRDKPLMRLAKDVL